MAGAKGITTRAEDYSTWYNDVIMAAELADYSPVKGCMVIRPHGYAIWEKIRSALDSMIKATGHKNAYFPLFIPESFFKKESEHVEGFVPYVATVTHAGGKKLEEPLYVRPTSETIMYYMYAKWISSWRDLPLLINQWANVVRWEMRTRLFLRTTEFLWQEGHTAHATAEEAEREALTILDMYAKLAEEHLAIPVIKGRKSESEKFAGAQHTYCVEAMMQDRKALQAGTSHNLGQNFAKAFDVKFQDRAGATQFVWQTSWGVSTRLIGAVIMAHSDDTGLVLPPKIAPVQVAIVPIFKNDSERSGTVGAAHALAADLKGRFDVEVDDRDEYKPGHKFFEWERKGVPLRIEIGPREVAGGTLRSARRDDGTKSVINSSSARGEIASMLEAIQSSMFKKALDTRIANTHPADSIGDLKSGLDSPESGFFMIHWCGSKECESALTEETKGTIRCIPLERPESESGSCIKCGKPSAGRVVFARAY